MNEWVLGEARSAASSSLPLFGDYSLADPGFLALAPLALLALWLGRARRSRPRGRISVLPAAGLPRSLRQRLAWLPAACQALALLAVIVALARPLRGNVLHQSTSEGVDVALVVDRSSSMGHDDLEAGRTRLDVVVDVVGDLFLGTTGDSPATITINESSQLTVHNDVHVGTQGTIDIVDGSFNLFGTGPVTIDGASTKATSGRPRALDTRHSYSVHNGARA